ncbi:hypothetical protein [Sphingomonas sp. LHG3443-2]|uniref:hypothetical protein n=1 Tax=Sphingomonas sp. LHG3443-2 TaxID=2804639 RepID=UPI003CEF9403
MPAYVRSWLLVVSLELLLAATAASAQSGVYLPPAPQGPGGEDTIETQSGTRCRQSINGNEGYLDVGVTGTTASGVPNNSNLVVSINERDRHALGYARITVPLGRKPKRLDCSRIYELEIQRLRDELALLKMNAE